MSTRRLESALLAICIVLLQTALNPFPVEPAAAATAGDSSAGALTSKLDLNSASLAEVQELPIPPELARRIVDHRTYITYFTSIYDLMDVVGMTPAYLEALKPLVATLPPAPGDRSLERLAASFRQASRFLGQEGASEGLVDEYLDQLRYPVDVNQLDLFDLMSYQNVSPVDATKILHARDRLGQFENGRQLRRAEGLRYWAYRNLRDFVVYDDPDLVMGRSEQANGYYQLRLTTAPFAGLDDEISSDIVNGLLQNRNLPFEPALTNKLRVDLTHGLKAGILTNRWYGDSFMADHSWRNIVKGFVGLENKNFGAFHLKGLYFGNFRAAFGLGLIMDNTDFILFRKTGYGWNKRPIGLRPDMTRTQEFALSGVGVEGRIGPLYTTFFYSDAKKDGIFNPDGTINQYILMIPLLSENFLDTQSTESGQPFGIRRNAIEEKIFGGNLKFMLGTGSFIGLTGYEARYNRGFRADVETLVDRTDLLEARDSEIFAGYTSVFEDPTSGEIREYKWRRVFGGEFQTVFSNVALQGEYAFLQDPRNNFFDKDNPDAWIVNAYTQWNNLNVLAIYRDVDLAFDNPYNRIFGNDRRYEQTILDAPFRLENDLYTFLELRTPQSKPEKGLFLDTRYRVSRHITMTGFQFDQWQRQADGQDQQRYTLKAEFQPIFNLRLRVRHRFSSRSELLSTDVRKFQNWETRWQLITLLPNYNRLEFGYMTSNVTFPARPRLSGTDEPGGDSTVGLAAAPANAFWIKYEHNLTPGLRFLVATSMYDGFFWNFEGTEFFLLDGNAYRNWFMVESRLGDRLLFQAKVTRDHEVPMTNLDVRRFNDEWGRNPDADYVTRDLTYFRLQLDYSF